MRALQAVVATGLGALALAGCTVNHYQVSMTPVAGGLRREVACWRGECTGEGGACTDAFPAERLARVARAYGKPAPESCVGKHVFEGVFTDTTPDDVGGSGLIGRTTTTLGSVWHYLERFRGDQDPRADLERRFRAADRVAEFLSAWFATQLAGKPGWDRLEAFLGDGLRRDLKDIALLDMELAAAPAADRSENHRDENFTLFLVERGYLRPAEVPRLRTDPDGLVARIVARRMGIADADPVPEALSFLGSSRLEGALRAFSSSPLVQRYWQERAAKDPDLPKPEDMAVRMLGELLHHEMLDIRILDERDTVEVSLACGVEPIDTDGEWRPAEGRIVWPEATLRDRGVPGLLHGASWATPDEAVQRARFGRVILTRDALAKYAEWRTTLPAAQGERWDRALAALAPGPGLASALAAIRLPAEDGSDLSADGRALLEQALSASP